MHIFKGSGRRVYLFFTFLFFIVILINSLIKNFYNLNYYNAPIGDKLYKGFGRDSPINSTITYIFFNR